MVTSCPLNSATIAARRGAKSGSGSKRTCRPASRSEKPMPAAGSTLHIASFMTSSPLMCLVPKYSEYFSRPLSLDHLEVTDELAAGRLQLSPVEVVEESCAARRRAGLDVAVRLAAEELGQVDVDGVVGVSDPAVEGVVHEVEEHLGPVVR